MGWLGGGRGNNATCAAHSRGATLIMGWGGATMSLALRTPRMLCCHHFFGVGVT
jgi:hypothetical protein